MSSKNYYGLVINLKERNASTKEKSSKDLASSKDLNVELHDGRDSTYHRLNYI